MKFSGLNFGSSETLSKVEQKKVKGGFGYGDWNNDGGGSTRCDTKFCTWTTGTDSTHVVHTLACNVTGTKQAKNCLWVCASTSGSTCF